MKRDDCDLHEVRHEHIDIHNRCLNWARYVGPGRFRAWGIQPMFQGYRSSEVWAADGPRNPVDQLDGHAVEIAVSKLPKKHRDAIRWTYVFVWIQPGKVQRHLAVTRAGLADLIHDGRSILRNRTKCA